MERKMLTKMIQYFLCTHIW